MSSTVNDLFFFFMSCSLSPCFPELLQQTQFLTRSFFRIQHSVAALSDKLYKHIMPSYAPTPVTHSCTTRSSCPMARSMVPNSQKTFECPFRRKRT